MLQPRHPTPVHTATKESRAAPAALGEAQHCSGTQRAQKQLCDTGHLPQGKRFLPSERTRRGDQEAPQVSRGSRHLQQQPVISSQELGKNKQEDAAGMGWA